MGKVLTFYSYKGGTGRSMTLANVAWILADNGHRVLVIDWDLEAPGLHRYFKPFMIDPELFETDGLIDVFWALATRAFSSEDPTSSGTFDVDTIDLEDYICNLQWDFPNGGAIDFIGAGRQGATYSERVNTLDWKRFYDFGGGRLLDEARKRLSEQYDYVLIDSRTGVSDTSGICTIQFPDILVPCFTLNHQSIEGTAAIVASVRDQRADDGEGIALFPIAMRIENSEKVKLDMARARARDVFAEFLPDVGLVGSRDYWDEMEVSYRPFYAYEEVLAAFGDPSGASGSADTLLGEMELVARRITGIRNLSTQELLEADRQRILDSYAFDTLPAEEASLKVGEESDSEFLRGILAKEAAWRLGGFRYRDLLSQRERQLITEREKLTFGRHMNFFYQNSELFAAFRQHTLPNFYLFLFSIFIYLTFLVSISGLFYLPEYYFALDVFTLPLFLVIILFFAFRVLVLYKSAAKPYGITMLDILRMSLGGPLVGEVRDYVPYDRQEPARKDHPD